VAALYPSLDRQGGMTRELQEFNTLFLKKKVKTWEKYVLCVGKVSEYLGKHEDVNSVEAISI
jgi:hypothetical protein